MLLLISSVPLVTLPFGIERIIQLCRTQIHEMERDEELAHKVNNDGIKMNDAIYMVLNKGFV